MPPAARPPGNNQGLKIVLGIVLAIVVLCACAGVVSLIVLSILGAQVNNIFSNIASALGTPTP